MPRIELPAPPEPCILESVQPLLLELKASVHAEVITADHAGRAACEAFVHDVFAARYRADVQSFYPDLLEYRDGQHQRAVVGMRQASAGPLFAERYLGMPAEEAIGERFGTSIPRDELVEVGNLALENPGDARWVIAATIQFLHELGYRWVLFTATRVLVNAFQRLGMRPMPLAAALPDSLGPQAQQWGDYYRTAPRVCAGPIASGFRKLHRAGSPPQPKLEELLAGMTRLARRWRDDDGSQREEG
ncbi:MAG: thermostable hemolysin [Pseudomonadota bacterium]